MKQTYLEVTFRRGRPLAAYLYLPRSGREKSHRTVRAESGLLIDFDRQGKPIGIEITAPAKLSLAALNATLRSLGLPLLRKGEIAPLLAASRRKKSDPEQTTANAHGLAYQPGWQCVMHRQPQPPVAKETR